MSSVRLLSAMICLGVFPALCADLDLIQNASARQGGSLNGQLHAIVDPYESGYYDYRYQPRADGGFGANHKPQSKGDLVEYDFDAAACYAFLQKYDLTDHLKMNIEANHATLAGHTFQHELAFAAANGILGSVDANRGDQLLGWDTDQFPTDVYDTTLAMYIILKAGGLTTGGLNFDAKVRRQSIDPVDLFYAHIGVMDAFALGLKYAAKLIKDKRIEALVKARYGGWDKNLGAKIEKGGVTLTDLETYTLKHGEPTVQSGRQELIENLINECLFG